MVIVNEYRDILDNCVYYTYLLPERRYCRVIWAI